MKNFFQTKGCLSLCIGEGYLSSFEVSTLKKGDAVITSQLAGYPYTVLFNGSFLCRGEAVVMKDNFGIRVTGLSPSAPQGTVPGNSDDAIELLPTRILLGSINVSLAELEHIGVGSFINLGIPYSTEQDVQLLAAGIPVAAGRTIVYYENMGIRINEVFNNSFEMTNVRTSGFILEPEAQGVKDYDYKRPDKFTRNALMKIKDVHELFCKNIRVRGTEFKDFIVEYVDQCNYGEAMDVVKPEKHSFILARVVPWEREYENRQNARQDRVKLLLEEEGTNHPLDQATKEFIEKILHSNGSLLSKPVMIFFREDYFPGYSDTGTKKLNFFISCLRGGWKNFADINFQVAMTGKSGNGLPDLNTYEMVVIIKLVHKKNPGNYMMFVYPYITLESIIELLQ